MEDTREAARGYGSDGRDDERKSGASDWGTDDSNDSNFTSSDSSYTSGDSGSDSDGSSSDTSSNSDSDSDSSGSGAAAVPQGRGKGKKTKKVIPRVPKTNWDRDETIMIGLYSLLEFPKTTPVARNQSKVPILAGEILHALDFTNLWFPTSVLQGFLEEFRPKTPVYITDGVGIATGEQGTISVIALPPFKHQEDWEHGQPPVVQFAGVAFSTDGQLDVQRNSTAILFDALVKRWVESKGGVVDAPMLSFRRTREFITAIAVFGYPMFSFILQVPRAAPQKRGPNKKKDPLEGLFD